MIREGLRIVKDHVHSYSIHQHHSNLPLRQARKFTHYLHQARKSATKSYEPISDRAAELAAAFRRDAIVTFSPPEYEAPAKAILAKLCALEAAGEEIWNLESSLLREENGYSEFPEFETMMRGLLSEVLHGIFGCDFKLHHFRIFRSTRLRDYPRGSELWHSDTGPGTCINVVMGLTDLSAANGATEVLPWGPSKAILKTVRPIVRRRVAEAMKQGPLNREELREITCKYIEECIDAKYSTEVVRAVGPSGSMLLWNTNALHRGGFPDANEERVVMLCHAYPSDRPTNWERYRREGCGKFAWPNISGKGTQPYPDNPADDF